LKQEKTKREKKKVIINMECTFCKEEIEGNPQVILKILTTIGYEEKQFCTKKCYKEFVNKVSLFKRIFG